MNKIKEQINKWNDGSYGPAKWEWFVALFFVVLISGFFCFIKDFELTVTQSLTFDACLFNGKLHKFYSIVNEQALSGYYDAAWGNTLSAGANYSIINYATLGILCLPFYVFEKVTKIGLDFIVYEAWLKLLFLLAVLYLTKVTGDICNLISMDKVRGKWVTFCFLTSPILWYSFLMISQMDIFPLLFLMLGIRCSLKGKGKLEILFYAIAVFYKPFALLAIIPLVLLKEKRIFYIIRNLVLCLAGILVQNLIYGSEPGYVKVQEYMSSLYNFADRFFVAGIPTVRNVYAANAGYFIFFFVLVCVLAYSIKKVNAQLMFAVPFIVWCGFILFVQWHPNWLVFMVPFAVISLGYSYRVKLLCAIECVFTIFFLCVNALGWRFNYDNDLINGGVLTQLLGMHSEGGELGTICKLLTTKFDAIPVDLYISVLLAATLAMMVAVVIDLYRGRKGMSYDMEEAAFERGAVWLRVIPMIMFVIYSFVMCFR